MFCYAKILGYKTHPKLESDLEQSRTKLCEKMLRLITEKLPYLLVYQLAFKSLNVDRATELFYTHTLFGSDFR